MVHTTHITYILCLYAPTDCICYVICMMRSWTLWVSSPCGWPRLGSMIIVSHNILSYQILIWNIFSPFSNKKTWKDVFSNMSFFKKEINSIFMKRFSIPCSPICIPFVFTWIWIQFKVYAMSLNIFVQMELNFSQN